MSSSPVPEMGARKLTLQLLAGIIHDWAWRSLGRPSRCEAGRCTMVRPKFLHRGAENLVSAGDRETRREGFIPMNDQG